MTVADAIGTSGERLTRSEAFDLVRRAVESLVTGDDSTSASAARERAFELLGRNSESLSARNFERVLQDAHDANMIDLRRRGNDFEVARAAEAVSIVEQLKVVDDAHKAEVKAANALLPQAPRGMGARGIGGGRGMGGRGKGPASPSPELLMVGVVGRPAAPEAAPAALAAIEPAEVPAAVPAVEPAAPEPAKARKGAAKAATKVAKAPAKKAAKTVAKVVSPAPAAKTAKVAAKKAPAKKAVKR